MLRPPQNDLMFERYTEKARRTIFMARYEASQFGSPYIESEHLLLGVLREDKALSHRLLASHSAVEQIRREIEGHTILREKVSTSVDLPLSNECKRVLAYAAEESEQLHHHFVGCEHLLLGLLREDHSFAAALLHGQGVSLTKAREDLQQHGPAPAYLPQQPKQMIPFGWPVPSFPVSDLNASVTFYKKLGFRDVYGQTTDPIRLLTGTAGLLALYDKSLGQDLVCVTGGDLSLVLDRVKAGDLKLEHPLSDPEGSNYLLVRDPDGHPILLLSPDLRTL